MALGGFLIGKEAGDAGDAVIFIVVEGFLVVCIIDSGISRIDAVLFVCVLNGIFKAVGGD